MIEFSPFPDDPRLATRFRRLARLQGAVSWAILLGLATLALVAPAAGAIGLVVFLGYFLLRSAHHALFLVLGFLRYWVEDVSDWSARLESLVSGSSAGTAHPSMHTRVQVDRAGLRARLMNRLHRRTLGAAHAHGVAPTPEDLARLRHAVIVPIYKETRDVFESGVRALASGDLPAQKHVVLVLALEERSPEDVQRDARTLADSVRDAFCDVIVTVHPHGLPGEIPGKASNETYAAREVARWASRTGTRPDDVLVSVIDADAIPHNAFLAALSYQYLSVPNRKQTLFQPLPVFDNNIWDVPGPIRLIEMMSTIFTLVESTNVEGAVTFSSYCVNLETLSGVGYWPTDVIAEDAAIYWKLYLALEGNVRVVPVPIPLGMDAVADGSVVSSFRTAYRQKLRWAYGVELVAPVVWGAMTSRMSFARKFKPILKLLDNNTSWATWPFLLTFGPWLPRLGASISARSPLELLGLEILLPVIFGISGAFLFIMVVVSTFFALRRAPNTRWWMWIVHPLEWLILLGPSTLVLSGLPALHAQTLLMRGKRLAYVSVGKRR